MHRLRDKRVCVCVGAGGVGKTTTAAALGLGLARRGRRVAVLTIDPAKRLAGAMGLEGLSSEPHPIDPALLAAHGIVLEGELSAMTLDVKGTFDALVQRLAPDRESYERVLDNSIYHELSTAVAGSQEYTAMAKLYELTREHHFDVVVLDTPPSRHALDFLDAPARLVRFIDGRALKIFLAPGGSATRLLGRGTGLVLALFARLTGVDLFREVSAFFGSIGELTEGFAERARGVEELMRDPATAFLLLSTPEPEPAREALFLAEQLAGAHLARTGVILNRVHPGGLEGLTVEDVRELLAPELGADLAARAAGNLADFDVLVRRDRESIAHLSVVLQDLDPILIPHLDADVQDLAGLAEIERHLFA
jgi:anion-transporting  ArsA/GET3 family ATPase